MYQASQLGAAEPRLLYNLLRKLWGKRCRSVRKHGRLVYFAAEPTF